MGDFIYFTEEQKERANAVPIMDILKREHEEVERSGNEWRWKRHGSVTFRGNRWYRHSQQMGSHAIDFMQEFFGMSYPEAVTYLLNGETEQVIHGGSPPRETAGKRAARPRGEETTEEKEPKILVPPEKNDTMKRVYVDCQHFFRQIFLGYFSDIVQAFDTLRKNVCGDDYTSLHNPIVLSSVLPAYGMFHSIQILFL